MHEESSHAKRYCEVCPAHCPFLACQWSADTKAWVEEGEKKWREIYIVEGTAQGDTSSAPAFSRGLRVALEEAAKRIAESQVWAHIPSLVDDMLLVTQPEHVEEAMAILREELAKVGLKLNLDKSAAYTPARSAVAAGPDERIRSVPQVEGGLPALGSAYGGDFESVLGPYATAAEPAWKRLTRAARLANECSKYRDEVRPESSTQAAWYVLRRVASKALVYDVRTLEPSASMPLAEQLEEVIVKAAKHLICLDDEAEG